MKDQETKPAPEMSSLHLCNLASQHGLKKAREIIAAQDKKATESANGEESDKPKKLSAAEKKVIIGEKLVELGVELPLENESIAKWETALATAEEPTESNGDAASMM